MLNRFNLVKGLIVLCGLSFIANVYAAKPGFYTGIDAGWGRLNQGKFLSKHVNDALGSSLSKMTNGSFNMLYDDTGMAIRLFAGYQLNSYFALEAGYTHFTPVNASFDLTTDVKGSFNLFNKEYNLDYPINFNGRFKVQTESFDVVGKAMYPITTHFHVFGKAGLTYLYSKAKGSIALTSQDLNISVYTNPSVSVVYPTFTLGTSYELTENVSADVSYTRIQKVGEMAYPNIDFISAGLSYHF